MCLLYGGRLWFKCSCGTWKKCLLYGVSALECLLWRFCYKGFLLREVSILEDVRFREVPLYTDRRTTNTIQLFLPIKENVLVYSLSNIINKSILEWFLLIICKYHTLTRYAIVIRRNHSTYVFYLEENVGPVLINLTIRKSFP